MKTLRTAVALLLVLFGYLVAAVALVGCKTSEAVTVAVPQIVPNVVSDAAHYASGNPDELATVAALKAAEAKPTTAGLTLAWNAVVAWYQPAYRADPALGPAEVSLRDAQCAELSKLLADDAARPLAQ